MKFNYAIYHKNCLDGFSSLIVLIKSKKLEDDAIIVADMPSTTIVPNGIDNKNIIIMDVAYKYEILQSIIERAKSVVFIDHHITVANGLQKLRNQYSDKLTIIYNIEESGASLTWMFLFKNNKLPLFIEYIKDNDIGKWSMKHTIPFIHAIKANYETKYTEKNVELWLKLFNVPVVKKITKRGKIYEEFADHLLDENARRYSLELFPSEAVYKNYSSYFKNAGQYKVAVFNGGCPNPSLLGNYAVNNINCDFAMIWTLNLERKEYIISLRSKDIDVAKIAESFNGGGHKLAAAFAIPLKKYNIQDLFFSESLPRIF